jgi:hypothetical protein
MPKAIQDAMVVHTVWLMMYLSEEYGLEYPTPQVWIAIHRQLFDSESVRFWGEDYTPPGPNYWPLKFSGAIK